MTCIDEAVISINVAQQPRNPSVDRIDGVNEELVSLCSYSITVVQGIRNASAAVRICVGAHKKDTYQTLPQGAQRARNMISAQLYGTYLSGVPAVQR